MSQSLKRSSWIEPARTILCGILAHGLDQGPIFCTDHSVTGAKMLKHLGSFTILKTRSFKHHFSIKINKGIGIKGSCG